MLAPLMAAGDLPLLLLRMVLAAAWAISAALTFLLHRKELGVRLSVIAGILVGLSPVLFTLSLTPLSETTFSVLAALSLLLFERWRRSDSPAWGSAIAGGLLVTAVCLTRSMGVILLPLGAGVLLANRASCVSRRLGNALVFLVVAVLPLLAWQQREQGYAPNGGYLSIWTHALGHEETNSVGLQLQAHRLARFGPLRLESLKETVLPKELCWRAYRPPLAEVTTWLLGGALALIALIRTLLYRRPSDAFVVLTLLMLALWPWDEGVRLVTPVMVVTAAYPLWLGARLWARYGHLRGVLRCLRLALAGLISLQIAGVGLLISRVPDQRAKAESRLADMSRIAGWLRIELSEAGSWAAYLPDRHAAKLSLIGAAYLARRPLTAVDVRSSEEILPDLGAAKCIWWHESLAPRTDVLRRHRPCEAIDGFRIYRTAVP